MPYGGISSLRDWAVGDRVSSREHHQEPIDAIRELYGMISGLLRNTDSKVTGPIICKLVDSGPSGEADGDGAVYWLQKLFIKSRDGSSQGSQSQPLPWTDPLEFGETDQEDESSIIPGTNLEEFVNDTHLLDVTNDEPIVVFEIAPAGTADNYRCYVFQKSPPKDVIVFVTIDGGVAGDPSTNCTLTYTAKDKPGGTVIAGGLGPESPAIYPNCEYVQVAPDSPAFGYYDDTGTFHLAFVPGEIPAADVIEIQEQRLNGLNIETRNRDLLVLEAYPWGDWAVLDEGTECPT